MGKSWVLQGDRHFGASANKENQRYRERFSQEGFSGEKWTLVAWFSCNYASALKPGGKIHKGSWIEENIWN